MAQALASARLGGRAEIKSAGLAAQGGPACDEAVLVMKLLYNLDISEHIATPVGAVRLSQFDHIVALDYQIYRQLRETWGVPEDKLQAWDIEDPIGLDYEAFKETAKKIERRLGQFIAGLELDS